jgi:hypothetical protein
VTEPKSPFEQALDLVFYAPVGLAVTAREELPRLIEKGRQRVTGQVTMARMIGQFVVTQGQHEVGKVAKQANDTLVGLGFLPAPAPPPQPAPTPRPTPPAAGTSNGKAAAPAPPAAPAVEPAPSSDGLAIPGYDSLSASQVVQRLAGLAPGELEAVRDYEAITRGRRTILNRISQLQTGVG